MNPIVHWVAVPSCLKSWATLLPLTGSESSMGVWITCRSPAPNVIVLYRRNKRGQEKKKHWKGNQRTISVSQKIRLWQRGSISGACPESSMSQQQQHGESQKLSRYITNRAQAIPADQGLNGAGQNSMPNTLLPNKTGITKSKRAFMGERNPSIHNRDHAQAIFHRTLI